MKHSACLSALLGLLVTVTTSAAHATPCERVVFAGASSAADASAKRVALEALLAANELAPRLRYQRALIGASVSGDCAALARLDAAAPTLGFATGPVTRLAPHAASSVELVGGGATAAELGLTGAGVEVAILDAGVDYLHPALGGPGDPEVWADNDPTRADDVTFPTAVVGGLDLAGVDGRTPDPDPFPDAAAGALADPEHPAHHGTALASLVHAIAPDARLLAYKILGRDEPTARLDLVLAGLERAVDPNDDGDFGDAADLVLLAWAGLDQGNGGGSDALTVALSSLAERGVLVVTPAGNAGPGPFGLTAPCAVPSTLCVAATYPSDLALPQLEVTSPPHREGDFAVRPGPAGLGGGLPTSTRASGRVLNLGDACGDVSSIPNLLGKIGLFQGGDCDHGAALDAAAEAQAEAVLLIAPPHLVETWRPAGVSEADTPVALLSYELGRDLREAIAQSFTVEVDLDGRAKVNDALQDHLATLSARGPGHLEADATRSGGPDLAAPGYAIPVALTGPEGASASLAGTSLAAAHAAGVLALLRERTGPLSPAELTGLVVQSARPVSLASRPFDFGTASGGPSARAPITRAGGGRVSLADAVALYSSGLGARHDQGGGPLGLGFVPATEASTLSATITLRNRGEAALSVTAELALRESEDLTRGVAVRLEPEALEVPAGGEATVTATFELDPRRFESWRIQPATAFSGDPSLGDRLSESEIDGALRFRGADFDLALPFSVLPRASSAVTSAAACLVPDDFDLALANTAVQPGPTELFTLGGTDPVELNLAPRLDLAAAGLRYEEGGTGHLVQVALALHGPAAGPDRVMTLVSFDTDEDGDVDAVLADLPDSVITGGLASGASRSVVLFPDPAGALDLGGAGRFRRGPALWTLVDVVGQARILTADAVALGVTGTRPFGWRVESRAASADLDGPHPIADALPGALTPGAFLRFDPTCSGWTFVESSVYTEERTKVQVIHAPSCTFSGKDGVLAVHLGNTPSASYEVLEPPTEAHYECAAEMVGTAHPETCNAEPAWNSFLTGDCSKSAFVEGDLPAYPPGRTPATLQITDYWGNETSCQTEVVIEDITPPVVDCGAIERIDAGSGMLPLQHQVSAFDNCTGATARVVGWRCLIHEGSELRYDVSDTCAIALDGTDTFTMLDLGRVATLVEWTVLATDERGNEEQTECYAFVDRDLIQAGGGGGAGCAGGGAELLGLGALLAGLGLRRRRS